MMKRKVIKSILLVPLLVGVALSSCHTQQHILSDTEQHAVRTQQSDSRQVVQVFDSLLHTLAFSADSVVIEFAYPAHANIASNDNNAHDERSATNTRNAVRLTAHRPCLTSTAVSTTQTTAATTTTGITQSTESTQFHTDQTEAQTSVASPMNGTLVVIAIVVIVSLLAAVFLYLFLRKWRIL